MALPAKHQLTAMKDALFATLSVAEYGAVFPYSALSEIMGADALKYRYVLGSIAKRLEREAQRTLESIRGHGYRIALPKDHLHLGVKRQARGRRQIESAVRILKATPVHLLSSEERKRHGAFLTLLHQQADVLRSMRTVVQQAHHTIDTFVEERIEEAMKRIQSLESLNKD